MFKTLATLMGTGTRVKALAYFLRRQGEYGSPDELAPLIGASREETAKACAVLARVGIIERKRLRRRGAALYRANERHPLTGPLAELLTVVGRPSAGSILASFRGVRGLVLIVASGILAGDPRSSVDLLIVCRNPKNDRLLRSIRKVERLVGLPVRYAVLGIEDYAERQKSFDRLMRDITEFGHVTLLGEEPLSGS
ncbi:MAG: hypothetical protein A2854_00885 [Parcubacteria group bacterium RIFCSPHIGHO2_01_FULL_56_18]|nr:MAG: hypothetical protein A2854_00885 [Parcubacteria group bacterium RIFCSPHIGHO2_01_FULL_56_18]